MDVSYWFGEAGTIAIHDDRWLTYPWGVNGGEPCTRSRKWIERANGITEVLPSNCHDVPVAPGDVLHFVTWGGAGATRSPGPRSWWRSRAPAALTTGA